jgi:hypothetical protein
MNLLDLGDKHGKVSVLMNSELVAVEELVLDMSAAVCYAVVRVLFSVT